MAVDITGYTPKGNLITIMLTFTCDYCKEKYKARVGMNGKIHIKSNDGGIGLTLDNPTDPCGKCEAAAEDARKKALAERKKSHEQI